MLFLIMVGFVLVSSSGMVLSTSDHCYTDIGCFPITPDFYHPRYRPINLRPWHRDRIKTTFKLFNSEQTKGFFMRAWDHANLQASRFNPMLETKIIIPGWLDNMSRTLWVKKLKDTFLWLWEPVNIIIVEWRNFTPYTIATANTRVVGAEIANLLKFVEEVYYYKRDYYHLIGHSLGAHIASYCGDRLPGLGRITALDPARPYFQNMPKSIRLDRGDAKFVDAIHSDFTPENAFLIFTSFGITTPVGHADFFPNGPSLLQPGCFRDAMFAIPSGIDQGFRHGSLAIGFLEAVRYLIACDHQRSHEWFIESVFNQDCMFVGVRCSDYDGVINGRCSCDDSEAACAIMGIHADQMYIHGVQNDMPFYRENDRQKDSFGLDGVLPYGENLLSKDQFKKYYLDTIVEDSNYNYHQSMINNHANGRNQQPKLLSELDHDIESWYENNNRWFLMTNNKRSYCVHQYQVLIFIGPLQRDRIKANLIISLIGSEGRLLNQRFVPRSGQLTSDTLQPFYVLFESAFSLGAIHSVAIGWEPRNDPDRVKATVEINSDSLVTVQKQIGKMLPTVNIQLPYIPKVYIDPHMQAKYHLGKTNPFVDVPHSGLVKREVQPSHRSYVVNNLDICHNDYSLHMGRVKTEKELCRKGAVTRTLRRRDDHSQGKNSITNLYDPILLLSKNLNALELEQDEGFNEIVDPITLETMETLESEPRTTGSDIVSSHEIVPSEQSSYGRLVSVREEPARLPYNQQHNQGQKMMTPGRNEHFDQDRLFERPVLDLPNTINRLAAMQQHLVTQAIETTNRADLYVTPLGINFRDNGVDGLVINQIRITPIQAYYGKNHQGKVSKTFCPPKKNYPMARERTLKFMPVLGNCFVSS